MRKRLERPDDVGTFNHGRTEIFELGDTTIGRQTFDVGFRWSADVRPVVGTEWCEVFHQGLVVSGRLQVVMADGPELLLAPGELFEVPPGHDACSRSGREVAEAGRPRAQRACLFVGQGDPNPPVDPALDS